MKQIYGSLFNRLMENSKPVTPEVGMGATLLMYSDRHAATVTKVFSPTTIVIQEDNASRTDKNGMSESQEYAYTPNTGAEEVFVTLRKDGRWKVKKSQTVVMLGERDAYHDYSF